MPVPIPLTKEPPKTQSPDLKSKIPSPESQVPTHPQNLKNPQSTIRFAEQAISQPHQMLLRARRDDESSVESVPTKSTLYYTVLYCTLDTHEKSIPSLEAV